MLSSKKKLTNPKYFLKSGPIVHHIYWGWLYRLTLSPYHCKFRVERFCFDDEHFPVIIFFQGPFNVSFHDVLLSCSPLPGPRPLYLSHRKFITFFFLYNIIIFYSVARLWNRICILFIWRTVLYFPCYCNIVTFLWTSRR